VENKNGRQDAATMKMLIKLCAVQVKKQGNIGINNMYITNKNTISTSQLSKCQTLGSKKIIECIIVMLNRLTVIGEENKI